MLAVVGLVAFAGYGASGVAGRSGPPAVPPITRTQAAQVLTTFAEHAGQVTGSRRVDLLNTTYTGPLLPIETGSLTAQAYREKRHGGHRHRTVTFSDARYLIPRTSGYPQWFAVNALAGGSGHRTVLVFARQTAQAPFKASYAPVLIDGSRLPRLRYVGKGRDGRRVATVPMDRSGMEVTPKNLASLHASVNQRGSGTDGGGALASGPWTTGMHGSMTKAAKHSEHAGFGFHRYFHPTGYPIFTLATAGGGALVWYAVGDEISCVRDNDGANPRLWVPDDIAGVIGTNEVSREYQVASVHEYLTVIPPHGKGRAHVIGTVGGPVGGVGR